MGKAPPRPLLAAHVVALLRDRLRASPARSSTPIVVKPLGVGGKWDVVDIRLAPGEILIIASPHNPEAA